jgi:hypothetical protein
MMSNLLGFATATALGLGLASAAATGPAVADTRLVVREESWSFGRKPPTLATLVRTEVSGSMRRLENEVVTGATDSLKRAARHVQIDRVDRDTSYYLRDAERAYLTVAFTGARDNNLRTAAAWRYAQAHGTAPRDTIPPVTTRELARTRTIAGVVCHGWVVALRFTYHDPAGPAGEALTGVLADTLWMAPPGSPADPLAQFERSFARATAADSFLAAPNAVQLAEAHGQGLVTVLMRAVRRVPGFALESSYENALYGVPKGMTGVERRADGGVVVQRTRRRTLELATVTLTPGRFDVPRGYRRLGGGVVGGAGGGAP